MRVAFRADASVKSGSGHVMRCLTLAEELRGQGAECSFICKEHDGNLINKIRAMGFPVCVLDLSSDQNQDEDQYLSWLGGTWQDDAARTLQYLKQGADWLIVDHYSLDFRWESLLASAVRKVMVIDDLANRMHACDLLLDQNLGRTEQDYVDLVPEQCACLTGPEYALLRTEFSEWRKRSLDRKSHFSGIKRVLISMGGSDPDNTTEWAMELLARTRLDDSTVLDIVMGASSPHLEQVRRASSLSRFNSAVSVNVANMAERMAMSDLSVGAAGSTAWERCCLGLPSLMLVLAENQRLIAEKVQSFGAGVVLKGVGSFDASLGQIEALLFKPEAVAEMNRLAALVCDGLGRGRVAGRIMGGHF